MNFKNQLEGINVFHIIRDLVEMHDIKTYVIGGYVRDLIIERNSNDIDIMCLGSGIHLAQLFKNNIGESASLTIYKQFGTACVKYQKLET